jgi:hypothetical protein
MYEVAEMCERVEGVGAGEQPMKLVHSSLGSEVEDDGDDKDSADPIACGKSTRHIEQTEFVKAELPCVIHEALRLDFEGQIWQG